MPLPTFLEEVAAQLEKESLDKLAHEAQVNLYTETYFTPEDPPDDIEQMLDTLLEGDPQLRA
eukprot:6606172-Prymnesium_polylepis.1